jgi:ATP-dependent Clp protease adaptor protein ClpS
MNPLPPGDCPRESRGPERPMHRPAPAGCGRTAVRYKVMLHRSPDKGLMFIVRTVMELTRYCREEATHRMWEALHVGRSQVLVTHRERAELYVEQFADRGLVASLEPAT